MATASKTNDNPLDKTQYLVSDEPYYRSVQDEVSLYEAAYDAKIPVMLKGPDRVW